MIPYALIQRKRDGGDLAPEEISFVFRSYLEGSLPDYQMSAFLMAVFFRGLSPDELAAVVAVMLESGAVLDLSDVPGIKVDKHSTGGVGDKVSLVLAPLVASLGVPVPMMSGRGLGHTGGTLDKLEAIPGFRTDLGLDAMRRQMKRLNCAMVGQTEEIAPLDRRLYALRDVTATVESIPLIASSIMSKKLAEGIDALVLDVKWGNGAFLPDLTRALDLAGTMIGIGERYGRQVVALLTAMDRPLGQAVGNALETEEAILVLRGEGPEDVRDLTLELAAEMLMAGRAASHGGEARSMAERALADGRALERMREIVEMQGGDPAVFDDPSRLPQAPVRRVYEASSAGYVGAMDTRAVGLAAVALGAGRTQLGDAVDPAVGFRITARPGTAVFRGDAIATVHARSEAAAEAALAALAEAIPMSPVPPPAGIPLISHRVTIDGIQEWKRAP